MGQVQETEQQMMGPPAGGPEGEEAESAPSTILPTALALMGFVIIGWTMIRAARRKGRSRAASEGADPRERIRQLRETAEKQSSLKYQAEATELTRVLSAQLDSKAQAMEQLIAAADDRLASLRTATGDVDAHEPASTAANSFVQSTSDADPMRMDIFRLADEGLDPLEIAQKLEQPIGQVRLILALRRA